MKRIFGIFRAAYPLEEDKRRRFLTSVIISIIVVGVLFLFKPFGLANITLPIIKLIPVYIGYGLVTLLVCVIADTVVIPAFPDFFNDQKWNVGRQILWTVFIIMNIGLANLFYSRLLGFTGISGSTMLTFQAYTIMVALLPVTIVVLITQIRLLSRNLKAVQQLNAKLRQHPATAEVEQLLEFSSDNGKDAIHMQSEQFLYAESTDNYTDIVYIENGIVKRELLRSTLKRIETLNQVEGIVRVHRSFVVNLSRVSEVTGNSQGYRLIMHNLDESIPVARGYSQHIKELLTRLHAG